MENESVAVPSKVPKRLTFRQERFAKSRSNAPVSTGLSPEVRDRLTKSILELKGALKGKVAPPKMSMGAWRKQMWQRALKKANGDRWKAIDIIKKDEDATLKKMGLEHLFRELGKWNGPYFS